MSMIFAVLAESVSFPLTRSDLFYRAATELVTLALEGKTSLTVAEAVAGLLQTWNKMFYQYRRFDSQHFADIERLIRDHLAILITFRQRVHTEPQTRRRE
jgi:hypothetical protein